LYLKLKQLGLIEELFDPEDYYFKAFNWGETYSTKQAAEILSISGKEQTLINFLNREDFSDYIIIFRKGARGSYRYDQNSLFQFKMILLLSENGYSPSDIATLIGTRSDYYYSDRPIKREPNRNTLSNTEDLKTIIKSELRKEMAVAMSNVFEGKMQKIRIESKRMHLQQRLKTWEDNMKLIVGVIESIELSAGLFRNISKFNSVQAQEPKSFWQKLFGSQPKLEPNIANTEEYKNQIEELQKRHQHFLKQKEDLEKEKSELLKSLSDIENELKLLESSISNQTGEIPNVVEIQEEKKERRVINDYIETHK